MEEFRLAVIDFPSPHSERDSSIEAQYKEIEQKILEDKNKMASMNMFSADTNNTSPKGKKGKKKKKKKKKKKNYNCLSKLVCIPMIRKQSLPMQDVEFVASYVQINRDLCCWSVV